MKSAAIIGCGRAPTNMNGLKVGWGIARAHAHGYREAFKDIRLYAVDINEENLRAFAQSHGIAPGDCFTSTDELYAAVKPDAVSVCTWPALHVPQSLEAIERGVPAVICEKPLGVDNHEILKLIEAAGRKQAKVAVAHQRRYEAPYVEAKRLIDSGALGEKLTFEGRVGDDWDILSWTVHWFDMANYFFGTSPKSMLAGVNHQNDRRYGQAVERASVIYGEYDGGREAIFITGPGGGAGVSVRGERGMLVVGNNIRLWTEEGFKEIKPPAMPLGAFGSLFDDLWKSVGNGGVSRCGIEKTAAATQMAYAAHESARTATKVMMPMQTMFAPLEVMQHRPKPAGDSLAITLLADAHFPWPDAQASGRRGLIGALEALGHRVKVVQVENSEPTEADLAGADVLALYHTQTKSSPQTRSLLDQWITAGKPVLVSHCGIGAYPDWAELRKYMGQYWVWHNEPLPPSEHPHLPVMLEVADDAFGVSWKNAWLPKDEVYTKLGVAGPTRTLLTAKADGLNVPYAWQTIAYPNVVTFLPGHRADMFELDAIRDGLAASLAMLTRQRSAR